MDQLDFWKTCCERGITICQIPRPFKDRRTWAASHTFDSEAEMFAAVESYLTNGNEPAIR